MGKKRPFYFTKTWLCLKSQRILLKHSLASLCYWSLIPSRPLKVLRHTAITSTTNEITPRILNMLHQKCDLVSHEPSIASFCTSWNLQAVFKDSSKKSALQSKSEKWAQLGRTGTIFEKCIQWATHWLIHKTMLAIQFRPTESYTQKQILVKAAFITINKSRQEQTGLHWFLLFSVQISILSVCCSSVLKWIQALSKWMKSLSTSINFGERWLHFLPFRRRNKPWKAVCSLPRRKQTKTTSSPKQTRVPLPYSDTPVI